MNIAPLIKDAQQKLTNSPFDEGHDLVHHYKVWENCFEIIMAEKIQDISLEFLQLAVWFHDVDRTSTDHPTFVESAKRHSLTQDQIDKVLSIINSHSYLDERGSDLESKVLFDADKVEYIGYSRWLYISNAIVNGDMPVEVGIKYAEALNSRMPYIVNNLNFARTKLMIKRNLDAAKFLYDKGLLVKEVADRIDWVMLMNLIN